MQVPWRALGILVLGGSLGTLARVLVASWLARPGGFPWATLAVNASGSFALGLFMAAAFVPGRASEAWRLGFAVAFLGAYTTMSAYAYDAVDLAQRGRTALALAHVLGNPLLSVLCAALGVALGRAVAQ